MSEDPKSYASVIDMLTHDCHKYAKENARLKAEVERLYRHGDLLLKFAAKNMPYPAYATYAKDWLAAKEGKPSV